MLTTHVFHSLNSTNTVDSLITHTPYDINTSPPVWIGQKYIVYEITNKYGSIRWPTSYNNMCGRQKYMLVFMGMGYKGVDCSAIVTDCTSTITKP